MKPRIRFLFDLQLFNDAEDGAGAEPAAVDTQQSEVTTSEPVVVYGKQDPEPGTDTQTVQGAGDAQPGTEGAVTEPPSFNLDFNQLTPELRPVVYDQFKDQFKDEFTQDFQKHFNQRFKSHKEVETRVNEYDPVIKTMMQFYGAKTVQELQSAMDTEILPLIAEREGFADPDKFREHLETRRKADQFDALQQQQAEMAQREAETAQKEAREKAVVQGWIKEGLELKKTVTGFDLATELNNEAFARRLEQGYSVADAYELAHMNDKITETAKRAQETTMQSIKAKNTRISEVALNNGAPVIVKSDPSKFTSKDMDEIRKRVSRGEKISF